MSFLILSCTEKNPVNNSTSELPPGNLYYQNERVDLNEKIIKFNPSSKAHSVVLTNCKNPIMMSNGKMIATTTLQGIDLYSSNFNKEKRILSRSTDVWAWNRDFNDLAVSEIAQLIAFENEKIIYIIDFDGNLLYQIESANKVGGFKYPTFSADGNLICVGLDADQGLYYFYLDDIANPYKYISVTNKPLSPSVSPDGSTITFVMNGNIYLLNIDDTNLRMVVEAGGPSIIKSPVFSLV